MLVIGGRRLEVAGRKGTSFLELPSIGLGNRPGHAHGRDWRPRPAGTWIRGIVLHTRMGRPVIVRHGEGPNLGWDLVLGERFAADDREASCHIAVDADGSYACLADLCDVVAYHAEHVNEITVGIEMYQAADGGVWESTLRAAVDIVDVITRELGIQRQYPLERTICRRFASPGVGVSRSQKLAHVPGGARGRDFCGVYGHRNVTRNRGMGDPGEEVFELLKEAGYEGYLVDQGDDLDVWADRQKQLGMSEEECDGIAGTITRGLVAVSGRNPCGVWIKRPCDEQSTDVA